MTERQETCRIITVSLTVFCCHFDTVFILWGLGVDTHEVEPAHMPREALKEVLTHKRSIVKAFTGTDCGFQGDNSAQC